MADDYGNPPESGDANRVIIAADEIAVGPPKRVVQWVKLAGGADGAMVPLAMAEDAVHASGDFGIMSLGVRKDSPVALAGTDGDYMPPIYDSTGRLWVRNSARNPQGVYRAGTPAIAGATTAGGQNLMSIENPSGSGRTVYIKKVAIQWQSTVVETTHALVHFGRGPLPSAGTAVTAQKVGPSTQPAQVALVKHTYTGTASAGDMATMLRGIIITAVGAVIPLRNIFEGGEDRDDVVLAAGEAFYVRSDAATTTTARWTVDVLWEEV